MSAEPPSSSWRGRRRGDAVTDQLGRRDITAAPLIRTRPKHRAICAPAEIYFGTDITLEETECDLPFSDDPEHYVGDWLIFRTLIDGVPVMLIFRHKKDRKAFERAVRSARDRGPAS